MKTAPLTADQLTAAVLNLVTQFDVHRLPRDDFNAALVAFLTPLTSDNLKARDINCLLKAANGWYEASTLAFDDVMENKPHAWAKHAEKDKRHVEVIAASICDGGRPE